MHGVSDESLWQFRMASTKALVEYARERLSRELAAAGVPAEEVEAAKHLFNPDALTLGFARRFATYKRPNLLLHDPARLLRILSNAERPVQLIIAGKAHPADLPGLLRRLGEIRREEGSEDKPFEVHVISIDAFSVDGVRRLEDQGVTDVIVGFRWPYVVGPDTEPLQAKLDNLRRFADDVMAKVRA